MDTYIYKTSSVYLNTEQQQRQKTSNFHIINQIYYDRQKFELVKKAELNPLRLKSISINTDHSQNKKNFLKMKSKKLQELNILPSNTLIQSNAQTTHRDSVHYLDNKFASFHLTHSDFDSESQNSIQYPIQHAKLAFYESLLSRKQNNLKSFHEFKKEYSTKPISNTNQNLEFNELNYDSFNTSPRRVKNENNRHISIRHFANIPKKKTVTVLKPKKNTKNEVLEDESIITNKISLDKVEETIKENCLEEESLSARKEKLKSDERFTSGSFRNQLTTSFPNLYASVSANYKKNRDTYNYRNKDSLSNVLNPKMSLMEKYNLNLKTDSSFKYTKLLDKRKKEKTILNSIDIKFNNLNNDESIVFESASSDYLNHSHGNLIKPNSQHYLHSNDLLVLPNVVKSSDTNKSYDHLTYGSLSKGKNEHLVSS
ncbi:unnamed protein product [Brachionus calyciflorus]|uniref:Uncharacterized protein n=1 Tax=Brachionus calyciflorus TaxID=104777 RepID=A0A813M8S0_9BILA|nr:unnamed protein product [Brachionus calyciflorus]